MHRRSTGWYEWKMGIIWGCRTYKTMPWTIRMAASENSTHFTIHVGKNNPRALKINKLKAINENENGKLLTCNLWRKHYHVNFVNSSVWKRLSLGEAEISRLNKKILYLVGTFPCTDGAIHGFGVSHYASVKRVAFIFRCRQREELPFKLLSSFLF